MFSYSNEYAIKDEAFGSNLAFVTAVVCLFLYNSYTVLVIIW